VLVVFFQLFKHSQSKPQQQYLSNLLLKLLILLLAYLSPLTQLDQLILTANRWLKIFGASPKLLSLACFANLFHFSSGSLPFLQLLFERPLHFEVFLDICDFTPRFRQVASF
jgi:hypothetical protein